MLCLVEKPRVGVRIPCRPWLHTRERSAGPALPDGPLAQELARKSGIRISALQAPCPAPSGQNVEFSRLEFGLHGTRAAGLSSDSPQAPVASRCVHMYQLCCTQLCLTLGDPMDCSPPGSSVHGNLQARVLEWVAIIIQRWAQKGPLPPLHPFLPPASPFALIPLDYFPFGSLTYFLFTCFLVYCFSPPVNCEPLVGWNIDHLAPFCLGLEHTRS